MSVSAQQLMFSVFIILMCAAASHSKEVSASEDPLRSPRRYLFLNSLLNLLNRWALGLYGLRFPLIMTASHMIFGSTALAPMMFMNATYAARHASVLSNDWKGLATIAVMNGFQIACNNASLFSQNNVS